MRYFMHDPSETITAVEDMRQYKQSPDEDEISLSLFNQLKDAGWSVSYVNKPTETAQKSTVEGNDVFAAFMQDEEAWDMFVTGSAGTGKTTDAANYISRCASAGVDVIVTAFIHKACDILRSKLPAGTTVQTLHSFLSKRPIVNTDAVSAKHLQSSQVCGNGGVTQLLIVDEYGMVGEKDLLDLRALQDPNYEAKPVFKVLWLGDPNQLPPVGDVQAVKPKGDYQIRLTKIHRTDKEPLLATLAKLVSFIEGTAQPEALEAHEYFVRGCDIVNSNADIILAYTNARVEELNALKQGYAEPQPGDKVFSPTTHRTYTFVDKTTFVDEIERPYGGPLLLGSKYKTLEYVIKAGYDFCVIEDEDGEQFVVPYIFGHATYNSLAMKLKEAAAASNSDIESAHRGYKATAWAKANPETKLARKRAKAWRDFLSFDECVYCLDFDHARTVHKSQGSTFGIVAVDMEDLGKCADRDFKLYLRLLYVAISRASLGVITN